MFRAPPLPHPTIILSFLLGFLVLYFGAGTPFSDPDIGWHLAAGDYILSTGSLPVRDPWSYTAGDSTWYNISWLWDVLISFLTDLLGLRGAFYAMSTLEAAILALAAWSLRQRQQVQDDALILVLLALALAFREFTPLRPHTATFLFTLIFHQILHRSRNSGRFGALGWLPVLMVPWVNMHGGFMVGFTLVGVYFLEALFGRDIAWGKRLALCGALLLPAALLNPYNIHMIDAVMRTTHSVITGMIQEWHPFHFGKNMSATMWLILMFACCARGTEAPLADRIVTYLWLISALLHTRNAMIFMLVSMPYVAINLQKWTEMLESWRTYPRTRLPDHAALRLRLTLFSILVWAALLHPSMERVLYPEGRKESTDYDISDALPLLEKNYRHLRFLNDYTMGGSLIYQTGGTLPVFIDGRAGTVYSEKVLKDYLLFLGLDEAWEEMAASQGVEALLLYKNNPFVTVYDLGGYHDRWVRVLEGNAQIFLKRCMNRTEEMQAPKRCATEEERR